MKVHITQCLCPSRHCIMAIVWEEPEYTPRKAKEALRTLVKRWVEKKAINHECAICGAKRLHYEDGVTPFRSKAEAMPHVKMVETMNLLSRQHIMEKTAHERN